MATKLLMLVVEGSRKEDVEVFLDRAGVLGYTEIPHALGVGVTGPRLGSRAFPKTSALPETSALSKIHAFPNT